MDSMALMDLHFTSLRGFQFFMLLGVPGVSVVMIFIFNYPNTVVFVAIIVSCNAGQLQCC